MLPIHMLSFAQVSWCGKWWCRLNYPWLHTVSWFDFPSQLLRNWQCLLETASRWLCRRMKWNWMPMPCLHQQQVGLGTVPACVSKPCKSHFNGKRGACQFSHLLKEGVEPGHPPPAWQSLTWSQQLQEDVCLGCISQLHHVSTATMCWIQHWIVFSLPNQPKHLEVAMRSLLGRGN